MIDLSVFEGATPGPWHDDGYRIYTPTDDEEKRNGVVMVEYKHSSHQNYVDFELMAAAPLLLEENRKLRELVGLQDVYINHMAELIGPSFKDVKKLKELTDNLLDYRAAIATAKEALG